MFVSIANALMIQGPITILGLVAQPDRVVLFSTSRTLARLGTSAMNILNNSATPEYSRLFGLTDTSKFSQILEAHLALASAVALLYALFAVLAGGFVLKLWTDGKLSIEEPFFMLLVFSTAAEMIWSALFVPLSAINRHVRVSYAFAILSLIGIAGCYAGAASHGLTGVALALAGVQLLMIAVSSEQLIQKRPK
jgi:O-antigen/teichoic acid export membrane protein